MNILKAVVSIYLKGGEKPVERYKTRISISEDHWIEKASRIKKKRLIDSIYAMDFETISKESLKLITKWKASYYTHPKS